LRGGPRGFRPGFPCPAVLRNLTRKSARFRLQDCYPLWCGFPSTSTNERICDFPTRRQTDQSGPATPRRQRLPSITSSGFGLFPFRSPLLRESRFLSFPPVTKMFQFTGLPPAALWIQAEAHAHYHVWVSPFGDPGIKGWSAPPPGLSQPPTSFIGSWRQGIHRVPFIS
jgi:hypothetical protein